MILHARHERGCKRNETGEESKIQEAENRRKDRTGGMLGEEEG